MTWRGCAQRGRRGRPGHAGARLRGPTARHRRGRGGDDMVARPPLKVRVEPMRLEDVPAVHRIDRASFRVPWPDYAFRQELQTNRLAHYLVVRAGSQIVAYGGLWLMVDEAHITTFAVLPEWRRRGVGGRLMVALMQVALDLYARL